MTRSSNAARIQNRRTRSRTVRVTLGELIAAAYDAAGPKARPADVARILKEPVFTEGLRPKFELD